MEMCARHYDNPHCHSVDEFADDLQRFKYVKKLVTRYAESGELRERLILNHVIVLNNLFGPHFLNRALYLKMKKQFEYIKPFLVMLNIMLPVIPRVDGEDEIDVDMIPMDPGIVDALRRIKNGA